LIPLITLAIEPSNPQGFCERFIADSDIKTCQERTKKEEVDWYAATVCNLQKMIKPFGAVGTALRVKPLTLLNLITVAKAKTSTMVNVKSASMQL